jgi:hypothetical protein
VPLSAPPVHHVSVTPQAVQAIVSAIAGAIAILAALGGAMLLAPKAVLVMRLRSAEGRAHVAEGALGDVSAGLEALRGEVGAMRVELAELRPLRAEVGELRRTLALSIKYNATLLSHARRRGTAATLPPVPDELEEAIRSLEAAEPSDVAASA